MPQRNIKKGCIFCQEVRESLSEEVLFALRPEYHVRVNHVALGRGISRCKGTEATTGLKRSWQVVGVVGERRSQCWQGLPGSAC